MKKVMGIINKNINRLFSKKIKFKKRKLMGLIKKTPHEKQTPPIIKEKEEKEIQKEETVIKVEKSQVSRSFYTFCTLFRTLTNYTQKVALTKYFVKILKSKNQRDLIYIFKFFEKGVNLKITKGKNYKQITVFSNHFNIKIK
jgi:hypothetical protein